MKSFKENWPSDGLNTLEYQLKEIKEEPLLTRLMVDFGRDTDKNIGTAVDLKKLVQKHPCLQSLSSLKSCSA